MYQYSTNSKTEKNLSKWEDLSSQGFALVHTMSKAKFNNSDLSKKKAEDVFKSWDIISTSLINLPNISSQRDFYHSQYGAYRSGPVTTNMFYEVGFILEVPPQNILGTHCKDVWFPNHIGADRQRHDPNFFQKGYQLADRVFSGIDKQGRRMAPKGYNVIEPPQKIWDKTGTRHNEILVVGREGVSMHFRPTGRIKVKEVIFAPKKQRSGVFKVLESDEFEKFASILRILNPGIRIKEV